MLYLGACDVMQVGDDVMGCGIIVKVRGQYGLSSQHMSACTARHR